MSHLELSASRGWRLRPTERRPLLIGGDFLAAAAALAGALYLWSSSQGEWLGFSREFLSERVPGWFYLLPIFWLLLMAGMYDIHEAARWRSTLPGVATAAVLGLGIYLLVYFSSEPRSLPRSAVGYYLGLVTLLVTTPFSHEQRSGPVTRIVPRSRSGQSWPVMIAYPGKLARGGTAASSAKEPQHAHQLPLG